MIFQTPDGTVLAKKYAIYYLNPIVKNLWIYLKCSDYVPKKEEMWNFYRVERKTEQKCKNKLKIWENLGNDQRKIPLKVKASLETLQTHSRDVTE